MEERSIAAKTIAEAFEDVRDYFENDENLCPENDGLTKMFIGKTYIRGKILNRRRDGNHERKRLELFDMSTWDLTSVKKVCTDKKKLKGMKYEVKVVAVITEASLPTTCRGYISTAEEYAVILKKRIIEHLEEQEEYKGVLKNESRDALSGRSDNNGSSAYMIYVAYHDSNID